MTELLRFIFSSFWTFAGTIILAAVVIVAPVSLICDAVVKRSKRKQKLQAYGPDAAKTIIITKRGHDYHAHLAPNTEIWGCGPTPDDAIRDLLRTWRDRFDGEVKVEYDARALLAELENVMADKQSRANFIKTLEEVASIAESCGELASKGIILALMSALLTGHDEDFLCHVCEFVEREVEWMKAQHDQIAGSNSV